MRLPFVLVFSVVTSVAFGQSVVSVYNRDTHEAFHLKNVRVESTVVGPMVKTSSILTYDNPYRVPTEATLNFSLPPDGALGGFAYYYGDEYVRGKLMDKRKAWFIYTAITSRGRDPGIMEQWAPTTYHCQIFPIMAGRDLRIKLWTLSLLEPWGRKLVAPRPEVPKAVGYRVEDKTLDIPDWSIRKVHSGPIAIDGDDEGKRYVLELPGQINAVVQRFRDNRYYVAGLIRSKYQAGLESVEVQVEKATYEPLNGGSGGADVTEKVSELVEQNRHLISAENQVFGDPTPNIFKRLVVTYRIDGKEETQTVPEHAVMDLYGEGLDKNKPTFTGLNDPKVVLSDPETVAFFGWLPRDRSFKVKYEGNQFMVKPLRIYNGSDSARLWSQQVMATSKWLDPKKLLTFSLKYGVPSTATAMLAVPHREMDLYREKAKNWETTKAEARRQQLEEQRRQRSWGGKGGQNWRASGGGDPEIRVSVPGANSVDAILPDGRVLSLARDGDMWWGNYEIPADAVEGTYRVEIVEHLANGSVGRREWTFDVTRTPPTGSAKLVTESDGTYLVVTSSPGLAEVAAYRSDGKKVVLIEVEPGVYRLKLPFGPIGRLTIVLKDQAGNKGEVACPPLD